MFAQFKSIDELITTAAENGVKVTADDVDDHNGDLFVDGMNAEEWLSVMTAS